MRCVRGAGDPGPGAEARHSTPTGTGASTWTSASAAGRPAARPGSTTTSRWSRLVHRGRAAGAQRVRRVPDQAGLADEPTWFDTMTSAEMWGLNHRWGAGLPRVGMSAPSALPALTPPPWIWRPHRAGHRRRRRHRPRLRRCGWPRPAPRCVPWTATPTGSTTSPRADAEAAVAPRPRRPRPTSTPPSAPPPAPTSWSTTPGSSWSRPSRSSRRTSSTRC